MIGRIDDNKSMKTYEILNDRDHLNRVFLFTAETEKYAIELAKEWVKTRGYNLSDMSVQEVETSFR